MEPRAKKNCGHLYVSLNISVEFELRFSRLRKSLADEDAFLPTFIVIYEFVILAWNLFTVEKFDEKLVESLLHFLGHNCADQVNLKTRKKRL